MRYLLIASTTLALLFCSSSQASDTAAPADTALPADHAAPRDASTPAHCGQQHPPHEEQHEHHMPPPHEPPLAAVKACLGKKNGSKTTIYLHGDSIPAVCRPYDGMLLAQPLKPMYPNRPPQASEEDRD